MATLEIAMGAQREVGTARPDVEHLLNADVSWLMADLRRTRTNNADPCWLFTAIPLFV